MNARRVALAAAAVLLAGCTAVPSHSAPQTISFIPQNPTVVSSQSPPPPGASPRAIVQGFLDASADQAGTENSAREYLTRTARSQWDESMGAAVVDSISVGSFTPPSTKITVTGRLIGNVDEHGIYTPTRAGIGDGGHPFPFEFQVKKAFGEYRINSLPDGLILTADRFLQSYIPHALEFYADTHLVPDLRFTPLTDRDQLAAWLVNQLAAGPRTELKSVVSTSVLPSSTSRGPLTVKLGEVSKVEIPGVSQLDSPSRDRLAAQISRTLVDVIGNGLLSITDGGKPIQIPEVHSSQFVASQFENTVGPPRPPAEVYYLRDGRVVNENAKSLPGTGVDGSPYLRSVALANSTVDPNSLAVAGGVVHGSTEVLYVGTQELGLRPSEVSAPVVAKQPLPLTRPSWAPGRAELWIGAGRTLYRLTVSGVATAQHRVDLPPGDLPPAASDQSIQAVRVSPDGSRIALVLGGSLLQGIIVRTAGQVRVQGLTPISPTGVVITDVAWNDPLKLIASGYLRSTLDAKICETSVDGSGWSLSGVVGLPVGPDSLTATANAVVWASVGPPNSVFRQSGSFWISPDPSGNTAGYAPVYLE